MADNGFAFGEFAVCVVDGEGVEQLVGLSAAGALEPESGRPVRSFPSWRGQRNYPGLWWSATLGHHIGYESWLERDHAMQLDFDSQVIAYAPQPFWLFWPAKSGKDRRHAPDWFARRSDGSGLVLDCRPPERIGPKDVEAFDATRAACREIGWDYEVVGPLDPVLAANLRWLSAYRHPRHLVEAVAEPLLLVFAEPRPLLDGVETVGDPIAVLPVLYHLIWLQRIQVDLGTRLAGATIGEAVR